MTISQPTPNGAGLTRGGVSNSGLLFRVHDASTNHLYIHGIGFVAASLYQDKTSSTVSAKTAYATHLRKQCKSLKSAFTSKSELINAGQLVVKHVGRKRGFVSPLISVSTSLPWAIWEAGRREARGDVDIWISCIDADAVSTTGTAIDALAYLPNRECRLRNFARVACEVLVVGRIRETHLLFQISWEKLNMILPGWLVKTKKQSSPSKGGGKTVPYDYELIPPTQRPVRLLQDAVLLVTAFFANMKSTISQIQAATLAHALYSWAAKNDETCSKDAMIWMINIILDIPDEAEQRRYIIDASKDVQGSAIGYLVQLEALDELPEPHEEKYPCDLKQYHQRLKNDPIKSARVRKRPSHADAEDILMLLTQFKLSCEYD